MAIHLFSIAYEFTTEVHVGTNELQYQLIVKEIHIKVVKGQTPSKSSEL